VVILTDSFFGAYLGPTYRGKWIVSCKLLQQLRVTIPAPKNHTEDKQTERQTDRKTDKKTDKKTDHQMKHFQKLPHMCGKGAELWLWL